jgi:hypothetical protein
MTELAQHFSWERLLEVAREYERRGYDVQVRPQARDLPEFLTEYEPDLVASKADERLIIEVKSRDALSEPPRLDSLARAIAGRKGWRLVLVSANPPREVQEAESSARSLAATAIEARLGDVENLVGAHSLEAALLLCWAAAEAAIRLSSAEQDVNILRLNPLATLKTAFSFGLLTRPDYRVLERAYRMRSQIAHGYSLDPELGSLTPAFLNRLVSVVRRMLKATTFRQSDLRLAMLRHSLEDLLTQFPGMRPGRTSKEFTVGDGYHVWVYMYPLQRDAGLRVRFVVPDRSNVVWDVAHRLTGVRARIIRPKGKGERLELFLRDESQIHESGLPEVLSSLYSEYLRLPGRRREG